jgi:amino acid transporter
MTALLWRNIESAGRLSEIMLGGVLLTMAWVIVAGLAHFSWSQAFTFPTEAYSFNPDLGKHIAAVSLLAMYNYMGYSTVCFIGDEVDRPHETMPRAIMLSIVAVVCLYILFSTVVLGTLDWQQVRDSTQIGATFIAAVYRNPQTAWYASKLMVTLILFVTATSLYAYLLGVSRVPYAAACNGQFFRIFSRTHPTLNFPYVSLLAAGLSAVPFCFVSLGDVVNWLMLVQIVSQFIWQCAGIMMLQSLRKDVEKPYRMMLYPIPAILSLIIWMGIFVTGDWPGQRFSLIFLAVAVAAGLLYERLHPQVD